MTNSKQSAPAIELEQRHHMQLFKRYPVTLIKGKGVRVTDSDGKEYLDALAGIAVNVLGHAHPRLVKAISEQAGKIIHGSNLYYYEPQSQLAEKLTKLAGLERVFFTNSGTEAMEGAIKLARRWALRENKRGNVVSMEGCFHGRSTGPLSTHSKKQREKFEPLLPGFVQIDFEDEAALEAELKKGAIAFIVEPVQGEGGVRPVSDDFLRAARRLTADNKALLICDEIQCGVARTGSFFAYQHAGLLPDIVTLAKGLGGGVPIGAVIAREDVAASFEFGDHGTTFGGNPLVTAAANAVIDTVLEDNLIEYSAKMGDYLMSKLRAAAKETPKIQEVRGRGLMIGVVVDADGKALVQTMLERGVLANCTGDNVIRFVPPLIITKDEIDELLSVFLDVLNSTGSK